MNKQANYIIEASLLLASIFVGVVLIKQLVNTKSQKQNSSILIDYNNINSFSNNNTKDAIGKNLFMSRCASCHQILKNATGPSLAGFLERGPWGDRKMLYQWIRNPSAFMKKNEYVRKLKKIYGSMMTAFPNLTNDEIDAICEYVNQTD